ncbi:MAG: hypothetical protein IPH31_02260 [Lewinellaceae bacterium]|nr:hypothetical protein [Lewinellaceae bacterium]
MKKIGFLLVLCAQYLIGNTQAPDWQWAKQMAGTFSKGYGIHVDASGNIYATGGFAGTVDFDPGVPTYNLSGAGADDGYISKLDHTGNFPGPKLLPEPEVQEALKSKRMPWEMCIASVILMER